MFKVKVGYMRPCLQKIKREGERTDMGKEEEAMLPVVPVIITNGTFIAAV